MIGVYRILNTKTKRSYIGSSENVEQRIEQHKTNISTGYLNGSKAFDDDFKEHGKDSFEFEILKELKSQKELESWENYFIGKNDSLEHGYNCVLSRRTPINNIKNIKYEITPKTLLTEIELAAELKLSAKSLNEIISNVDVPIIKIGNSKRYILEDVVNYFNEK